MKKNGVEVLITAPETLTMCVGVHVGRREKLYQTGNKGIQMDGWGNLPVQWGQYLPSTIAGKIK